MAICFLYMQSGQAAIGQPFAEASSRPFTIDNLTFRENKGQWNENILYKLDAGSVQIYAERGQLTWAAHKIEDLKRRAAYSHGFTGTQGLAENDGKENTLIHSHGFRMKFLHCNMDHGAIGRDSSLSYSNYFLGNDKSRWATHVRNYKKISYLSLYDGVDMTLGSRGGYLKYEFEIKAGIDPAIIQIEFQGVKELHIVEGNLYIVTSVNEIKELKPYAYQIIDGEKLVIPCNYKLDGQVLSYDFPTGYNPHYTLIIDPTLVFASYSGSVADNWGMTATPGPNGEAYGAGIVFGKGYPDIGAYDGTFNSQDGSVDIGVTKYTPDGTHIIYSTYLGGKLSDIPHSLIVNKKGDLIILGSTSSEDYPTSSNAYDKSYNGGYGGYALNGIFINGSDIVLSILSENGDALKASTFIGGSGEDGVMYSRAEIVKNYSDQIRGEVYIDDKDNIYVASVCNSSDFPIKNGFQKQLAGLQDAVIFSLNPDLSKLRWSTFFGGKQADAAYAIKLNKQKVIVGGGTASSNLFFFSDVVKPDYGGNIDGFVLEISLDGKHLLNGTYIGTRLYDQVYFTQIDNEGNIYIYGQSKGNMKVTPGTYSNDGGGMFIQKLDSELRQVLIGTRIGSGENIINLSPSAFLVDRCGRIYISGWGGVVNRRYNRESTTEGLPITPDAIQKSTDGSDFYFLVLEKDARKLLYATYFGGDSGASSRGGEHVDGGTSRFSKEGAIYQAVCASCGGVNIFPVTEDAARTELKSRNCNMAVIKFSFDLSIIKAQATLDEDTVGCAPFEVEFNNQSYGTSSYHWTFGDGGTSTEYEPIHLYEKPGTYQIQLIAISENLCLESDTAYLEIKVKEPTKDSVSRIELCKDTSFTITSRIQSDEATYQWNTGQQTPSITASESGTYYVSSVLHNCTYRDTFHVILNTPKTRIEDLVVCRTGSVSLDLDKRASNIKWNTGDTSQSISITEEGLYTVTYNINSCSYSDSAYVAFPDLPEVQLTGDSLACEGDEVILNAQSTGEAPIVEYTWNTGDKGNKLTITRTGQYIVTGTTAEGCTSSDTINTYFIPLKPPLDLPDSTILICADGNYTIDLSNYKDKGTEIVWNDGRNEYKRTFEESGKYSVTITNICQNLSDYFRFKRSEFKNGELPVYIPNAFSPNHDGINDSFKPQFHPDVQLLSYKLEIFDRWGNKIFKTTDPRRSWLATFKNKRLNPGIYMWTLDVDFFLCESPHNKFMDGDVSILK